MSIRIHKCMGYGLHILTHNINWNGAFERLDKNSTNGELGDLMIGEYERLKAEDHRDYMHFAIMGPKFRTADDPKYPKTFLDVIKHAAFDSDEGWLVFIPPAMTHRWDRFDNDMDYAEYHARHGEEFDYQEEILQLKHPLYPFIGYQDGTTGEKIDVGTNLLNQQPPNAVPLVPPCVRAIAEHTKVCDWRLLRPVIATWWG